MSESINYIDMPIEQLDRRGRELSSAIKEGYLNPERKAQVQKELGDISFEMWFRYQAGEMEIVEI